MSSSAVLTTTISSVVGSTKSLSWRAMTPSRWPEPGLSIGAQHESLDSLGRYKCWHVREKSPAHAAWKVLSKTITCLLEEQFEHLGGGGYHLRIEFFMIGRKPTNSAPTVLICSENKKCRRNAMELIEKKLILENHPGILLAHCSKVPCPLAMGNDSSASELPDGIYTDGSLHMCGISVLIVSKERALPRRATLGGFVLIQGVYYGLTTAHAFREDVAGDPESESDGESDFEITFSELGAPDDSSDGEEEDFLQSTSKGSISSLSSRTANSSEDLESEILGAFDTSDRDTAVSKARLEKNNVALGESTLPVSEALTKIGKLHLISYPEISLDWALVKIDIQALVGLLRNAGSQNNEKYIDTATNILSNCFPMEGLQLQQSFPTSFPKTPHDSSVLVGQGQNDAPSHGSLSGVSSFSKSSGVSSFQELWMVKLDLFPFVDGDCGSWVVDSRMGFLYGYIVSGGPGSKWASLVPAFQIFADVEHRLDQPVELPERENTRNYLEHECQKWEPVDQKLDENVHPLNDVELSHLNAKSSTGSSTSNRSWSQSYPEQRQASTAYSTAYASSDIPIKKEFQNPSSRGYGTEEISKRTPEFNTGSAKKTLREIVLRKIRVRNNTYRYIDIATSDDIRLLKIFAGKKSDPLKCMLFPSALPSAGKRSNLGIHKFWALSYWWGEDEPTHPITVYDDTHVRDGLQKMTPFNPSGIIYVRDNLATALMQFRRENEDVDIWCDAVCINQSDLKEKAKQVTRIHEIYSQAEHVCVWLGAGNDETKETFDFLRSLLNLQHLEKVSRLRTNQNRREWLLLIKLMKNRLFSRRWVIQELVLARNAVIRWGSEEMRWSKFADAITLLMTKHDEIKDIIGTTDLFSAWQDPPPYIEAPELGATIFVDTLNSLFRRAEDGKIRQRLVSLEALVTYRLWAFEISEPRDAIYAVLSLARDTADHADVIPHPSPKSSFLNTFYIAIWWYSCYTMVHWIWLTSFHVVLSLGRNTADRPDLIHYPHISLNSTFLDLVRVVVWWYGCYTIARWIWLTLLHFKSTPEVTKTIVSQRIVPDYEKPLIDVYLDFIEYCIETSQSLDIICRYWAPRPKPLTPRQKIELAEGGNIEEEKMPSWVSSIEGHAFGGPQGVLNGRINGDSLVGDISMQQKQHYSASGSLRPFVKLGRHERINKKKSTTAKRETRRVPPYGALERIQDFSRFLEPKVEKFSSIPRKFDGTMSVKGRQLGIIDKLTGRVLHGIIPVEALEYGGWPAPPSRSKYTYKVPEKLWRTLVADRGPNGTNAPSWYRRACLECLLHVNPNGDLNTNELKNLPDTPALMKIFLERVQNITWSRKFFLSKSINGTSPLYGLAPGHTAYGDIICILFGCSVPVVLRRIDSNNLSEKRYVFVGECYVHGMMDGEALPEKKPEYPYTSNEKFVLV